MTVTFFVNQDVARTEWQLECACGKTVSNIPVASYADGQMALELGQAPVCTDEYCAGDRGYVSAKPTEADAYSINVSNYNAKMLLAALGADTEDLCGNATAEDFLGRVLVARAMTPADEGTPAYQEGKVIYCGRPEGYTEDRFADLEALAKYAMRVGKEICWS